MLTIEIGIKNRDVERFKEYCEDNNIQITYSHDLGNCLFVNVSIDARKADEFMDEFA